MVAAVYISGLWPYAKWSEKVSISEELAASVISAASDIPANQMKWLRPDCALLMRLQTVQ